MNRVNTNTRAAVLNCLIEGCSIRSTVRITGVSRKAVTRLRVEAGTVAAEYQDRVMRNLTCRRLQVDELWTFNLLQGEERHGGDCCQGAGRGVGLAVGRHRC